MVPVRDPVIVPVRDPVIVPVRDPVIVPVRDPVIVPVLLEREPVIVPPKATAERERTNAVVIKMRPECFMTVLLVN
jgi:hypothetical protein